MKKIMISLTLLLCVSTITHWWSPKNGGNLKATAFDHNPKDRVSKPTRIMEAGWWDDLQKAFDAGLFILGLGWDYFMWGESPDRPFHFN